MLYEQTLDLDTFQSFLNENAEHDPRFYDEFFNLATSQEWKKSNRLPGLPTPPITPNEKTRFPWNFAVNNHHANNLSVNSNIYGHHRDIQNNQSKDFCQVVPDIIHEEREDYNGAHWFPESHHSMSSPINIRKPIKITSCRDASFSESPCSSNLEDQLRSTSKNFTHTHLNLQEMESGFPDCILSADRKSKGMKRSYLESYCSDMMMEAGLRSCDEGYFRQLAFEKAKAHQKIDIMESTTVEPELSKATHNVLERQRRNDLKLRFNILRDNIPEIINNDKVAKITVLKKACEYIEQLKAQEQKLLVDLELEKQRKIILFTRLKQLQVSY